MKLPAISLNPKVCKLFGYAYWSFIFFWFSVSAVRILLAPLTGDESIYLYFAQLMRHGGHFFDSFWADDKPGGIQLLYSLITPFKNGLFNFYAIRIFTVLYQALTVIAFYFLTRKIFSSRPHAAKLLLPVFVLVYLNPLVEGQFSNADNFVVLWILLAAHFFIDGRHLFSALAIGTSFCLKQNTALEILPSSLTLISREMFVVVAPVCPRVFRSLRIPLKQLAVFFIPLLIIVLYTLYLGTAENFLNIAFLNRIRSHVLYKNYDFAARYGIPIIKQTAILWVGMVGFILIFLGKALFDKACQSEGFNIYTLFWVLCSGLSVWVGGYFFPHYFIEITPVLVISAVIFLLEISGFWFCLLLAALSLLYSQWLVWAVSGLFCAGIYVLSRHRPAFNTVARLLMILVFLLITMKANPVLDAMSIVNSGDRFRYYSSNDRDVLRAAEYLRQINSNSVFIYDYTMELYCLSGITPAFRYGSKVQYVNYSRFVKDNRNYIGEDAILDARRDELLAMLKNSVFKHVVINYNTVRKEEAPQLIQLIAAMAQYDIIANFGGIWVYENKGTLVARKNSNYILRSATLAEDGRKLKIFIQRKSLVADLSADLVCGTKSWHYPENGIVFPMKATQDKNGIEIEAVYGGEGPKCEVTIYNIYGPNVVQFTQKAIY